MQDKASYAEAIGRKYPEQIVVAIARHPDGKDNPVTLGWSMITSGAPPMLAIAVHTSHYSSEAILAAREFVIAFPSVEMADDALYIGSVSGRDADKLAESGATTQPANEIETVLLSDAVANFECVLEEAMLTGDHWLFVGRVVAAHANTDPKVGRLYSLGGGSVGAVKRGTARATRS